MNAHALGILEFTRIIAVVAARAHSAPGAAAVRALMPRADRPWIEAEQRRVSAVRALVESESGWRCEPIPPLEESLKRLSIEGLTWSAEELLLGATVLHSSRRVREALSDPRRPGVLISILVSYRDALVSLPAQEQAIAQAIGDDGVVRDDASPALRRVRRELRQTEGALARLLEREMARLEPHHQVSDMSVTMRNGRWVMPMRREARAYIGGIVHDSSGTGATIFVEPPAAVEFGNRVRELEMEEQREVEKVLRALTDALRPYCDPLRRAYDALVALDALYARARYAIDARCSAVEFCAPSEGLSIVDGRHPLLLARGAAVVPFDLTLESSERTMLVSGPNTGGKTVLLKAIGLLATVAQAGVPVPVGPTTRLPVFDDVFADVGDEQSIEASLSTFSAHVKNLGEILRSASAASLVLVDELGSGTDPAEGAALGGAILETLTARGTLTVATTHLGQLKLLATEVGGVVNASLQFDAVALAPTYRLLKGIPGRSYGISIARRLALPEEVLLRAEARLPVGERDLAVLLSDIEAREARLSERERMATVEQDKLRARLATVTDREQKVRDREREIERDARREARRYLLDARTAVEQAIANVRAQAASDTAPSDDAARAARRAVEDAAAAQGAALDAARRPTRRDRLRHAVAAPSRMRPAAPGHTMAPLVAGDTVRVATLSDKVGRVISVTENEARVLVGSLTLTAPLHALTRTDPPPPPTHTVTLHGALPDDTASTEIDLRGMRVDEAEACVLQGVDAAIRADLREVRIIHGKGTGALRLRVSELLKSDRRVSTYRLGNWGEGGAGVTVVQLS